MRREGRRGSSESGPLLCDGSSQSAAKVKSRSAQHPTIAAPTYPLLPTLIPPPPSLWNKEAAVCAAVAAAVYIPSTQSFAPSPHPQPSTSLSSVTASDGIK